MKRQYPELTQLRLQHGKNKKMPAEYEEHILLALHHYPELSHTRINFTKTREMSHPMETIPAPVSLLAPPGKRTYRVRILEESDGPLGKVLLKNLPHEARMAAIAHELSHILHYESSGTLQAVRLALQARQNIRQFRRDADISVIEHGLGFELYTLASYIRTMPDLVEQYRDADVNRLNPNEILEALPPDQLHDVHRF